MIYPFEKDRSMKMEPPATLRFKLKGSDKDMFIDINKFREAITFGPKEGASTETSTEEVKESMDALVIDGEFKVEQKNGMLTKETMIGIASKVQDVVKLKLNKQTNQEERLKHMNSDTSKYLDLAVTHMS